MANMPDIYYMAQQYNVPVIEDACQAIGASMYQTKAGAWATGCFSFFPSKNLGGFGDGGLITTKDSELAQKIRQMRVHGQSAQYLHTSIGGNFRMDELQAALLIVKMKHLDSYLISRREHADLYLSALKDTRYTLPATMAYGEHTWNQFTILVPDGKRDQLKDYLHDQDIMSAVYYPVPLHQQHCYNTGEELPVTEKASRECLSLPIAAELTQKEIAYVSQKLLQFNKEHL
jgi:dTDP-4-amino-4,6-dideoxygalactose transaminase